MSALAYRGALEICEEIRQVDDTRADLEAELVELTGKPFDEFIAGMRLLLAPATPEGGHELHVLRSEFGGAL